MRKLLIALLLVSTPSFAGGKLIAQSFHSTNTNQNKIPSLVGISIYENMVGNVYFENFTSYSNSTVEDFAVNSKNMNTKDMVHVHIGNLIVGAGFQAVVYVDDSSKSDLRLLAQASYKLW